MNKVYLSGPITGLTPAKARFGWRRDFTERLPWKFRVLSPMRNKDISPTEAYAAQVPQPKWTVARDLHDIRECSVLVAHLLGTETVSIGTMAELGYAHALGKTIVTIMEAGNIHDHSFVTELSSIVVPSVEEAARVVTNLLSEGI